MVAGGVGSLPREGTNKIPDTMQGLLRARSRALPAQPSDQEVFEDLLDRFENHPGILNAVRQLAGELKSIPHCGDKCEWAERPNDPQCIVRLSWGTP
jgi:hypothetical protein